MDMTAHPTSAELQQVLVQVGTKHALDIAQLKQRIDLLEKQLDAVNRIQALHDAADRLLDERAQALARIEAQLRKLDLYLRTDDAERTAIRLNQ